MQLLATPITYPVLHGVFIYAAVGEHALEADGGGGWGLVHLTCKGCQGLGGL